MEAITSQTVPVPVSVSGKKFWAGRILSALVVFFLLFDSLVKVMQLAPALEGTARLGYPVHLVLGIGIVQLACTVAYVTPRTSVLGAVLLTGYLGGATATHVRIGEPFFFPILFGVVVWAGLYLRDERLQALVRGAALPE